MTERVHLIGVEDVTRAAHTMADAAQRIHDAARNFEDALIRNRQAMEEWLARFEAAAAKAGEPVRYANPNNPGGY